MMKQRLDLAMVTRKLVSSRSQAESWIKLGKVMVDGRAETKPGFLVSEANTVELAATEQYVSRAGLKLASVAQVLNLDFKNKVMLDVGSSTGGFTDYALQHGARKVIAVDVGTDQLHPSLRSNPKIELHEQTDIRDISLPRAWGGNPWGSARPGRTKEHGEGANGLTGPHSKTEHLIITEVPDIVVIDVSFISLREILPYVAQLSGKQTEIIAMVKPQFEATAANLKHKGVIKNDRMRRDILKDFEAWARHLFVIIDKADSEVAGSKGNLERFYKLRKV